MCHYVISVHRQWLLELEIWRTGLQVTDLIVEYRKDIIPDFLLKVRRTELEWMNFSPATTPETGNIGVDFGVEILVLCIQSRRNACD